MLNLNSLTIPQLAIVRPDGTKAAFAVYTEKDEQLSKSAPNGGLGGLSLDQVQSAKETLALDASDGKLDFRVNGLPLAVPMHTLFWSSNSAKALFLGLAEGQRELQFNGKKVEVTPAFKQWVVSTMSLESAPG